MRARVPASTANLGPGFDTLGLALKLWTEVTLELASSCSLEVKGTGSDFPINENHLALRIVQEILGHTNVAMTISSEIPVSRGLGSSASLAVAVAAAAGHENPLRYAALLEGHADNAAAAVMGGFVTATIFDGVVHASSLPLDPELTFVAIVPDRLLSTKESRNALPEVVPRADAVVNLGLMGMVIAGMADHRRLVPIVGAERLHQNYRTSLFPESVALLASLVEAGALASFWSGAGPTLLGVCHWSTAQAIREAGEAALIKSGLSGEVLVLDVDRTGLVVSE